MLLIGILILIWLGFGAKNVVGLSDASFHLYPFDTKAVLPLRGLLAIMIVLHHFNTLYPEDFYWLSQAGFWGVPVCTLFFFFSGYGLTISYINKGRGYLSGFFSKRLSKLFIPILITIVIHLLFTFFIGEINGDDILKGLSAGVPILPHLWFVCVLLLFYVIFYLCFRFFQKMRNAIWGVWICILAYMFAIHKIGWGGYYIASIHGFGFGVTIVVLYKKIKGFIERNPKNFLFGFTIITCAIFIYSTIGCYLYYLPAWGSVVSWVLPLMVIGCSSFYVLPLNKVLHFLGGISFEIYLVHVSVMLLMHSYIQNTTLFFVLTLVITLCFALSVKYLSGIIHNLHGFNFSSSI